MDLIDRLRELALRIPSQREHLTTEEATKNALVMPFINALGYNVFDPLEVVPEFTADVGTKKGEKVDYAIMRGGEPIILIECKWIGSNLDETHSSQLYRYFSVTPARFSVLTNGAEYRFYSDLEQPNKMDARPFLVINLDRIDERQSEELKKFTKQSFDLDRILSTASDLMYLRGMKRALGEEWTNPTEEFVRLLAARVYTGRMTQSVKEQFTTITKRAFHEFVNERINERLHSAMASAEAGGSADEEQPIEDAGGTATTVEEIEGFYIIKAIASQVVDPRRVFMRDAKSFCSVLLDDTNRQPLCKMYFNSKQKYIVVIDESKNAERHAIDDVNGIYLFADQIRKTALLFDGRTGGTKTETAPSND